MVDPALVSPVVLAKDQLLPVAEGLTALFPDGGLRRGSTVTIDGEVGATSLALSMIAEASRTGSWTAVVAMPWLGLVAAEEYGVDLTRVAVIDDPGEQWATVVAALVGAFDVVLTGPPTRVRASDGRRLAARMRERGTVLVQVDDTSVHTRRFRSRRTHITGDVTFTARRCEWEGLHDGHGRLTSRRVEVVRGGRGAAGRAASDWIWLPDENGHVHTTTAQHVVELHPDELIGSPDDVTERLRHLMAVPDVADEETPDTLSAGKRADPAEVAATG